MARYLEALRREIDLLGALAWAPRVRLSTIFLGGGTPSLLTADELAAMLDWIRSRFELVADAEITVECNPESVTRDKLAAYRAAGVNRISLGVQSLDDSILPVLGRLHDAGGARAAFETVRGAGFDNVSVDLMYGLPNQSAGTWTGSVWAATGVEGLPPEGAVVQQYWALARTAAERGFEHYEISNYARPGFRSRHNQIYWRAAEYLACGPGGCGFVGDVRYGNVKPVARYCATLEDGALPIDTSERLTPRQQLGERLILGLRLADGIPRTWLDARMAGDAALTRRVAAWREAGILAERGDHVVLTEAGFLVSDGLFVEPV